MSVSGSRRSFIGTAGSSAASLQPARKAAQNGGAAARGDTARRSERPS
jgi:hypothetical protein